jgi:tRNA (guanine-N7-)-methyltransferase
MGDSSFDVPGALYGSRLVEQPHVRPEVEFTQSFLSGSGPNFVEIGFDHGYRLIDTAQRNPEWQCLGLEVRQKRVEEVSTLAQGLGLDNCHAWRMDARTVVARVIKDDSIDVIDILYPTPWWDNSKRTKRLLIQAHFASALARVLRVGGLVRVETDVEAYAQHIEQVLSDQSGLNLVSPEKSEPRFPICTVRSRRQKKQLRDGHAHWLLVYEKLPSAIA